MSNKQPKWGLAVEDFATAVTGIPCLCLFLGTLLMQGSGYASTHPGELIIMSRWTVLTAIPTWLLLFLSTRLK